MSVSAAPTVLVVAAVVVVVRRQRMQMRKTTMAQTTETGFISSRHNKNVTVVHYLAPQCRDPANHEY